MNSSKGQICRIPVTDPRVMCLGKVALFECAFTGERYWFRRSHRRCLVVGGRTRMMGVYCVLYLLLRSETDHRTVEPRPF